MRSRWPFAITCVGSMAHAVWAMSLSVAGEVWMGRFALGTAALLLGLAVMEALRLEE